MAILIADRVQETSTSPGGTGTLTLTGSPVPGYKSFANGIGTGNSLYYTIYDAVTYAWEVGIGSWSANVLTRTTVLSNSLNTTAFISFTNGNTLNVWVDYPANAAVLQTDIGTAPNQVPLNQYLGKLAFQDVLDTVSNNPYYDTQISDVEPTLNLDFVNSKTLDSRITFTRSTTATYYDGKSSAVAEQNLFKYSQDFTQTSAWSQSNITSIVIGATAPDGTPTACTVQLNGSTGVQKSINQTVSTTTAPLTTSFYLKAGTNNFVQILLNGNAGLYANFDLSGSGAVGTGGLSSVSSITQVGATGWFRCVMPNASTNTGGITYVIPVDSTSATYGATTTATGTFLIWGAQLEQRASATAYNATTTTALTNYIPVLQTAPNNVARLDYNPVTGTPNGLLIEESRTNLCLNSGTLTNFSGGGGGTNKASADIAPDGSQNAVALTDDTSTGFHYNQYNVSGTYSAGQSYTFSIYVKKGSYNTHNLTLYDVANGAVISGNFNILTGALGAVSQTVGTNFTNISSSIIPVGNGWYRCSITGTITLASTLLVIQNWLNGATSYTGNGWNSTLLWGAQLEAGAFPTSYIPTVASQVTRSADAASMTGTNFSNFYNIAQGTMYVEASNMPSVAQLVILSCFNTTSYFDEFSIVKSRSDANGSGNLIVATRVSASIASIVVNTGVSVTTTAKAVATYTLNSNLTATANGNSPVSQNAFLNGSYNPTTLRIGCRDDGYQINGNIRKLQYYPIALSSAELSEMTA